MMSAHVHTPNTELCVHSQFASKISKMYVAEDARVHYIPWHHTTPEETGTT